MPTNNQTIESQRDLETIEFHSAWRTIQGEGPFAGSPAVFIRLSGCNLQCPLCDTDYTSKREPLSQSDISLIVDRLAYSGNTRFRLVVITGGEPFRQRIGNLCYALAEAGYWVQIETNGTFMPQEANFPFDKVCIVCSPKTARIHPDLVPHIASFKYVLEYGYVSPVDGLPERVLGYNRFPFRPPQSMDRKLIFVQPLDNGINSMLNGVPIHLVAAAKSSMDFGYTLSIQMHKLAGLP